MPLPHPKLIANSIRALGAGITAGTRVEEVPREQLLGVLTGLVDAMMVSVETSTIEFQRAWLTGYLAGWGITNRDSPARRIKMGTRALSVRIGSSARAMTAAADTAEELSRRSPSRDNPSHGMTRLAAEVAGIAASLGMMISTEPVDDDVDYEAIGVRLAELGGILAGSAHDL